MSLSTSFIDTRLYIVFPTTLPNIVFLLSNHGHGANVMKNYDSFVLGPILLYANNPLVENVIFLLNSS